nr:hypothetical protein CFP56_59315 [Quercus suber]
MATEDFSFPTIGDKFSCGIDSPPLWNLSPIASPNSRHEEPPKGSAKEEGNDLKDEKDYCFWPKPIEYIRQRKSFSHVETGGKLVIKDGKEDGDHEEQKMDMLWENFNEELSKNSSSRSNTSSRMQFGCVKALKTSNSNSATLSAKKPGMVVILKSQSSSVTYENPSIRHLSAFIHHTTSSPIRTVHLTINHEGTDEILEVDPMPNIQGDKEAAPEDEQVKSIRDENCPIREEDGLTEHEKVVNEDTPVD